MFMLWLPNTRLLGENVTPGDAPIPLRETVCGLPAASSVTETVPVALPAALGVKVTLIVQELVGASVEPQLFVWAKPALVEIPEIVSATVLLLLTVTGRGWLVVFMLWVPNARLLGENAAAGEEIRFCALPLDERPLP